ncbi:MAG: hypothetical protein SH850_02970 [Planctomycetaceae bacterium]|nr:hypothetical protein [Planctomycetaceae bacterium]
MSAQTLCYGVALMVALTPGMLPAQHNHHGHHHNVHHHGSHYGHGNWSYVVPHAHHHHGAYYVANNAYYYTPTPVVRVVTTQPGYVPQVPVVQQSVPLQFGDFSHCDDLAGRLEGQLNQLCLELHYNYRHNAGYAHTYREAYEVLQLARHIHAKEHQGDREAIRLTVGSLDERFHHVQEEIAPWTRQPLRPVGVGDVMEEVSAGEALLHHLCYDVGIKPHDSGTELAPPPEGGPELAPPPSE